MKTCNNCQFYTGVQCHGQGDYYGVCLKRKERIIVKDNTPCLQDTKTLRQLYYQQKNEIESLKTQNLELRFYKARYESKCRVVEKIQNITLIACKYIAKDKLKEWSKENYEYLMNYKVPLKEVERVVGYGKPQQDK